MGGEMMVEYSCTKCKFRDVQDGEPCDSCAPTWKAGDYETPRVGWQPRKPRRKDLQAQLDAANRRIAELEDAWLQDETIDVDGKLRPSVSALRNDRDVARKLLHEAEEKLAVANAEIESMLREIVTLKASRDEWKAWYDFRHKGYLDLCAQRGNELAAKDAIIAELRRELDEVKAERDNLIAWKRLYEWGGVF